MRLAGGLVSVVMAVAACGGIGQASSSAVVPVPAAGCLLPRYVSPHGDEYKYQTTWSFYRAFDSTLLARKEWDSELVPSFLLTHPEGFTGLLGKVGLFNIGHAGDDLSHIVIPV